MDEEARLQSSVREGLRASGMLSMRILSRERMAEHSEDTPRDVPRMGGISPQVRGEARASPGIHRYGVLEMEGPPPEDEAAGEGPRPPHRTRRRRPVPQDAQRGVGVHGRRIFGRSGSHRSREGAVRAVRRRAQDRRGDEDIPGVRDRHGPFRAFQGQGLRRRSDKRNVRRREGCGEDVRAHRQGADTFGAVHLVRHMREDLPQWGGEDQERP